jgi:hypothetical protein
MGYREEKNGRWAKPVGFHLFTVDESSRRWSNWFLGVKDPRPALYDAHTLDADGPAALRTLKTCEAFTRISVGDGSSQFHLAAFDL